MENTPSKMLTEAASIAIDAIESQVDTRTWRTRLRIQELILGNNPYLKRNPFIFDQKLFLYLLLSFTFAGSITTLKGEQVLDSGEKFEESDIEPVLYTDLFGLEGNAEYTSLIERIFQNGLTEGKNFEQIKNEISITARFRLPKLIQEMNTGGLINSNIFYKFPHGSNDKKNKTLPQLPAYI